jgi:hypothetical protein
VPQVRISVPPDFLSSLLALANLMRLSLMKAAQAALGAAPCRKSGPWAESDGEALQLLFAKSNSKSNRKISFSAHVR